MKIRIYKNKGYLASIALICSLSINLSSCRDEILPQAEISSKEESQSQIKLFAEADDSTDEGELNLYEEEEVRALTADLERNGNKSYPKPRIAFTDKEQVPVLVILKKQGEGAIYKQVNWTWKAPEKDQQGRITKPGRLVAGGVSIDGNRHFNRGRANWDKGWKMFCVIGGKWDESNKTIKFRASTDGPKRIGERTNINTVYMSKDWVNLKVKPDPDPKKPNNVLIEAGKTTFKNKGITILYRATNKTGQRKFVRGFHIETEKLSFAGQWNLTNLEVDRQPSYQKDNNWRTRFYKAISGVNKQGTTNYAIDNDQTSDFFITSAMPTEAVHKPLKLRASAIIGETHGEDGKVYKYDTQINNGGKGIKAGDFISIHTIEINKINLRNHGGYFGHPIEQFLRETNPDEEIMWSPEESSKFDSELENFSEIGVSYTGEYAFFYELPSASEARILFPGHRLERGSGNDLRPLDKAILIFNQNNALPLDGNNAKKFKEIVNMWGKGDYNYTSKYKVGSSNIIYGERFIGPDIPNGASPRGIAIGINSWRSAYRYERIGDQGILIRVRILGEIKNIDPKNPDKDLNAISKESYWEKDPGYGNEEYRLFVPSGRYWTKTRANRLGANTVIPIRVLVPNERGIAETQDAAYVTDIEHTSHAESPRFSRTNKNPHTLIARPENPKPPQISRPGSSRPTRPGGGSRPPRRPVPPRIPGRGGR